MYKFSNIILNLASSFTYSLIKLWSYSLLIYLHTLYTLLMLKYGQENIRKDLKCLSTVGE